MRTSFFFMNSKQYRVTEDKGHFSIWKKLPVLVSGAAADWQYCDSAPSVNPKTGSSFSSREEVEEYWRESQ